METAAYSISFCMKGFFFLLLTAITALCCNESRSGTRKPGMKKSMPASSKELHCNYELQKTMCKTKHTFYQLNKNAETEKELLFFIRDSLLPCWHGTKWNFYGTTETPREGSIACGYFVTTVLRDIGVSLQRIKLAQSASEELVQKVCDRTSIARYRNVNLSKFVEEIKKKKNGLYITGLDNHTGFLLNDGTELWFIHSTYVGRGIVLSEKAIESSVLASSKYRVVGKVAL